MCPGGNGAAIEDGDVIREPVGLLEVLRREEDGDAGLREARDDVPRRRAATRVEPGGRLVEEDHEGLTDQTRRNIEAPAHPAGVGRDRRCPASASSKSFEQAETSGSCVAGQARRAGPSS